MPTRDIIINEECIDLNVDLILYTIEASVVEGLIDGAGEVLLYS